MDVNKAATDMFGFGRDDILGRNISELQAPALRSRHAAAVDRYRRTGEQRVSWKGATVTARHRSGREFPVEISFGEFTEHGEQRFGHQLFKDHDRGQSLGHRYEAADRLAVLERIEDRRGARARRQGELPALNRIAAAEDFRAQEEGAG